MLHVVTHLDLGGAEQVALSLIEGLADQVYSQVFAVNGAGSGPIAADMIARLRAAGVSWHTGTRLPFKRGGLVQAGARLAGLIADTRPDRVHLHTELPEACWAVASLVSPRVRAVPVLRTIHNARLWPAWGAIGRWTERRLGDRQAVAVSQGALVGLETLRRAAGLAPLPGQGTRVIYNGVLPPARRAPAAIGDRAVRVLFAGRLEEQKGADLLHAIWRAARVHTRRAAQLTVLGEGALRGVLEGESDPSMTIADPVPRLADHLAEHDILLMPSRFEGLGIVAVEAFLAGLAVVGFDAPGLREVVPAGHPSLPPVGDVAGLAALLAAAIDDPGAFRSAQTAARVGERFAMRAMLEAYYTLYEAR